MESAKVASRVFVPCLFCFRAVGGRNFSQLISVQRGFAADPAFHLLPRQIGELLRDADTVNEVVAHIDEELEGDGEAVFHQPGGDEDALRIAQRLVAMADGAIGELHVIAVGDHRLVAQIQRERDEVVRFAIERGSDGTRHSVHHALQIGNASRHLAHNRVADAVAGLGNRRHPHHFRREFGL